MNANQQTHDARGRERTHFGFTSVDLDAKQELVDDVFHKVARRYDLMNDLMSAGLHRAWKADMVASLAPSRHRPQRMLDVAGGTGDVAFRTLASGGPRTHVTVLDINREMLGVGRERAGSRFDDRIAFIQGNAEAIPFADASFDAYTIAFGIRNVPRIDVALKEAHRVLKRGGRLLVLEFSEVDMPLLDKIYDTWSFNAIPRFGKMITGDAEPYQYLVESIRKFPNQQDFAAMIRQAGFSRVGFTNYTGGIAALHSGWKL
jgi:demethylmenaquinone methyltransferase / 2-methoxy-6-polyprenyl-1,4-benzoquinol methylase